MCNGKDCCGSKCVLAMIGKILLVIGGLNWGLVGVGMLLGGDWNVVHLVLGSIPTLEAIIYILVGVAAVISVFGCQCKKCKICQDVPSEGGNENMGQQM